MLGPAVHRGKDTTHKSLETMRNARAWPQHCWKSCANGSNIVALCFGDHGRKEMFGVVGWKVWQVSNSAQQLPTRRNNMQQGVQTDPTLLGYASAITEQKNSWELLAEKFDRFQTLRNNTQQHPTTCNRVCKRTQHVTSNNVGRCWPTMMRPFARVLKLTWLDISTPLLVFFTLVEMFCTKKRTSQYFKKSINKG